MQETMETTQAMIDHLAAVNKILEKNNYSEGRLIPILQEVQAVYKYLSKDMISYVATSIGVPPSRVYGVATFYAQFALSPKGVYNVSVCLGTACYVKGAGDLFNKLSEKLGIGADECTEDGQFSLTACRCIGACGLAPVLTVNEDVYGRLTVDDIDGILAKYTA